MPNTPWLDGLWHFKGYKYMVAEIKGQNAVYRNLAHYDYPDEDIKPIGDGTLESGTFDETSKEIKELVSP